MRTVFWVIVILGGVAAGFEVRAALGGGYSAPQQAAAAGIALCYVIIPYCIARAVSEIIEEHRARVPPTGSSSSLTPPMQDPAPVAAAEKPPERREDQTTEMQQWFKKTYGQDISAAQAARLIDARSQGRLLTEVGILKDELSR